MGRSGIANTLNLWYLSREFKKRFSKHKETLQQEMTNAGRKPRVSVGMPVYNGANFIEEALDSILDQTYSDFEVIICDNASTDRTPVICKSYSARDERIKYHRNDRNMGGANNFNRTFELSSGIYFKWAAHDDVIAEDFLAKCIEVLEGDPTVAVCSALTGSINENGELQRVWRHSMRTDSHKPHERFFDLLYYPYRQALYGLIRSSTLQKTNLLGSFHDSDGNLLIELALHGRLVELPELLFFDRVHPEKYTVSNTTPEERAAWFNPNGNHSTFHFPRWKAVRGYCAALKSAPLTASERASCVAGLLRWMGARWRVLGGELKNNMIPAL